MSEDEEIDNSWWEQILACFDDDMLCIKHARFVFLCQQQEAQLAGAHKEIEQLRARVAALGSVEQAAHDLLFEPEEYWFDDGIGRFAIQQHWDDLQTELDKAAPQQEQQE